MTAELISPSDLVGIPWLKGGSDRFGADCWGLTVMALLDVYGITVDCYKGSKASGDELVNIIESEIDSPRWVSSCKQPRAGDVAMMYSKVTGKPGHIGVFIGGGNILHSPDHDGSNVIHRSSAIHPVRLIRNLFLKLEFYRYDNDT